MAKGQAKPAAKPAAAASKGPKKTSTKGKDWKSQHTHLFKKAARDFRVGRDIRHKENLSRVVKWPRYVRIQRQRAILKKRLKVPPVINQFTKTVDKNQAANLFRLLSHYRPESKEDKKARLLEAAKAENKNAALVDSKKPKHIKYGINHITELVESKKAKLVVIAHDVDPLELVLWLPALCRKMDVPYCIVKGKARLGHMVYKKTATALALTEVNKDDAAKLQQLVAAFKVSYDGKDRKWGGGIMGLKAQHVITKRAKAVAREAAKMEKMK
jgi:large subunit ribosomal protein L7Ae